ncbi:STAS domain-containing protein [Actinoplanes sp. NPDC051859]|uniref:STAS domain-containing protein n=1 Tax=Actinoplanes sp. NPDC051859 TaxID=3363909 RepID=UPI0037B615D9
MQADQWYAVRHEGRTRIIALRGELDLAQADDLRALMTELTQQDGVDLLHIDLSEVTFLDSTIIGALITGYHAAQATDVEYTVDGAGGQVEKILTMAGVLEFLRGDLPPD